MEKIEKVSAKQRTQKSKKSKPGIAKMCGLCGKTTNLTKTPCCNQWICDDEDQYMMFSYARNSCSRNHDKYTLCSYHFGESHQGEWQKCEKCSTDFETEIYVYFGTNEYNFVKLENPPKFEPMRCTKCKKKISLSKDGYTLKEGKYYCMKCSSIDS